jgi:hypothetical protein
MFEKKNKTEKEVCTIISRNYVMMDTFKKEMAMKKIICKSEAA